MAKIADLKVAVDALEKVATPIVQRIVKAESRKVGPLQVLGRTYITILSITALAASASAWLDWYAEVHKVVPLTEWFYKKSADVSDCSSWSTALLRFLLAAVIIAGLVGIWLIVNKIAEKSPYLFNFVGDIPEDVLRRIDKAEPDGLDNKKLAGKGDPGLPPKGESE